MTYCKCMDCKHRHKSNEVASDNIFEKFSKCYLDEYLNKDKILPKYLEDLESCKNLFLIETKSKSIWTILFPMHFISSFGFFGDELNLNPFNLEKCFDEISISTAKDILEACKYLLTRKYSYEIENILNNQWIKIFGDILPEYHGEKEKGMVLSYDTQEGLAMIDSVRIMMESFINIHNEYDDEEIKLVYVVHG